MKVPWYVSGEIRSVDDHIVTVILERSGHEDMEMKIPIDKFPIISPSLGMGFSAKIDPEFPDTLLNIEILPDDERDLEDILTDIFGKDGYRIDP